MTKELKRDGLRNLALLAMLESGSGRDFFNTLAYLEAGIAADSLLHVWYGKPTTVARYVEHNGREQGGKEGEGEEVRCSKR